MSANRRRKFRQETAFETKFRLISRALERFYYPLYKCIARLVSTVLVDIRLESVSSYIGLYVFMESESYLVVLILNDRKQNFICKSEPI